MLACLFVYFLPFGCMQVFSKLSFMTVYVVVVVDFSFSSLFTPSIYLLFLFFSHCHEYFRIFIFPSLLHVNFLLYTGNWTQNFWLFAVATAIAAVKEDACIRPMLFNRLLCLCQRCSLQVAATPHTQQLLPLALCLCCLSVWPSCLWATFVWLCSACTRWLPFLLLSSFVFGNAFRLLNIFDESTWWKTLLMFARKLELAEISTFWFVKFMFLDRK